MTGCQVRCCYIINDHMIVWSPKETLAQQHNMLLALLLLNIFGSQGLGIQYQAINEMRTQPFDQQQFVFPFSLGTIEQDRICLLSSGGSDRVSYFREIRIGKIRNSECDHTNMSL